MVGVVVLLGHFTEVLEPRSDFENLSNGVEFLRVQVAEGLGEV